MMETLKGRGRADLFAAFALVVFAAAAVYAPTVNHGFAFDDVTEVVRNQHIRSLANLPKMFSSGAWEGAGEPNPLYRPLTTASYALNYAVGGLSPFGYHVANVVLHAVVSALVLNLGLRLGLRLWPAALAAALFAVHPVHVEVVANIAGRKDALAAIFVLLAVLAHPLAWQRGGVWVVAAPLAAAAALLSKESGVAALGLALCWDIVFVGDEWIRHRRRAVAVYGVYAVVFCLYLLARHAAVGSLGVPLDRIPYVENPAAHATAWIRLLTAVSVLWRGLLLLVAPLQLSPDYSYDALPLVTSFLDPGFLASLAALLLVAFTAALSWRRAPAVTFVAVWYALAIFPASNLLVAVGTIFGERLLYLPSVGFCIAAGMLLNQAWVSRARPVLGWSAAVILLLFSARTVVYSSLWSDEVSLFRAATRSQPSSGKAHELYGAALMEEGRFPEGLRELEEAVRILSSAPDFPVGPLIKLGVAYERLQRWEDGAGLYDRVLQRSPDYPDALWRLGVVRWAQGRRGEAEELWGRTVAVAPTHAAALSDLGLAAQARGEVESAEALWLRAVSADPHTAGPWLWLGDLYERRGDSGRARAAWARFLENARYGVYPRERARVEERLRQLAAAAGGATR